jgi:glycerol-3-phosphate O-acyltransferase / dihydroxyacetone phosphate acyltransferase
MLYEALRATAAIALRWYYADVFVVGAERIPRRGPLIVIANHPNALIDPLLVGTSMRRRVLLTAKATLFEGRARAALLGAVGVVPLRRARDEPIGSGTESGAPAHERNADSFRLVTAALRRGEVVLVFPEGISHDDPAIAPLKSGAARMALQARAEAAAGLCILPIGLIFEQKERPGSRVLVRIGDPLDVDEWVASVSHPDAAALTNELEARLRAVTLNFISADRAARAVRLARTLAAIAAAPRSLDEPLSLATEAVIARRIDAATTALITAPSGVAERADSLVARLTLLERDLDARGVSLAHARISTRLRPGLRFVLREGPLALLAVLVAALGRIAHWLPLHLARVVAKRSIGSDPSRDQPAMQTILFGLAFVVVWYAMIAALLTLWRGAATAALGLALIFSAAHADRLLRGRMRRGARRARTFLAFRADPTLRGRVLAEIDALLDETLALEQSLAGDPQSRPSGVGGTIDSGPREGF